MVAKKDVFTNKSQIERAGLSEKVAEWLFDKRMTHKEICEKLKNEHGLELDGAAIMRFKKYILATTDQYLYKNEEYRELLAKKFLDTVENLCYLVDKIKEDIEKYPDNDQWKQRATFYNQLIPVVNMLLKRSGEIKPSQFVEKQEVNIVQINQAIQIELVRLIDEGQIPLEHCSEPIKEFYRKMKQRANY
jgi:hypothetical protein